MNETTVLGGPSARAVIAKEWSEPTASSWFSPRRALFVWPPSPIRGRTGGRALCGPSHVHVCKWHKPDCFWFSTLEIPLPPGLGWNSEPETHSPGPQSPTPRAAHIWTERWAQAFSSNKENLQVSKIFWSPCSGSPWDRKQSGCESAGPRASRSVNTAAFDVLCFFPRTEPGSQRQRARDQGRLTARTRQPSGSPAPRTGFPFLLCAVQAPFSRTEVKSASVSLTQTTEWYFPLPQIKTNS